MRITRRRIVNLVLVLASIIFTFLAGEILLRFTRFEHTIKRYSFYNYPFPKFYFKPDPVKGYDIRENFKESEAYADRDRTYKIWSNEIGCFDTPAKNIDNYVLLVGDSFTHAYADFQDKWGTWTESLLGYRILKSGVSGYGTKDELYKAKDIISKVKHPPKLIILGYFINDLQDDYLFPQITIIEGCRVFDRTLDKKTGEIFLRKDLKDEFHLWKKFGINHYPNNPYYVRTRYFFKKHSIIYNLVRIVFFNAFLNPIELDLSYNDYPWIKNAWEKHFENLREFKKLAESCGARLLVVEIPTKYQVFSDRFDEFKAIDPEKPNRILSNFFQAEGIDFIDLLPYFKKEANADPDNKNFTPKILYWKYDAHWNKTGNHLAGLLVSKYILEKNLLNLDDRGKKIANIEQTISDGY